MSGADPGGTHLESVMCRLMDYLSDEKADQYDTMLMVGLVNLLGIVSAINKQFSGGNSAQRTAGEDPLMGSLMKLLQAGQSRRPDGGSGPPIDPALLMSLLGQRTGRPEDALLLALLNSMLQPPPPRGPHPAERRPGAAPGRPAGVRPAGGAGPGEGSPGPVCPGGAGKAGNLLNWDRRLG